MDRVPRAMSLIHDLAAKFKALWNHKAILEPLNSIGISSGIELHPTLVFDGYVPFQYLFFERQ
jgi:hypothetical protein